MINKTIIVVILMALSFGCIDTNNDIGEVHEVETVNFSSIEIDEFFGLTYYENDIPFIPMYVSMFGDANTIEYTASTWNDLRNFNNESLKQHTLDILEKNKDNYYKFILNNLSYNILSLELGLFENETVVKYIVTVYNDDGYVEVEVRMDCRRYVFIEGGEINLCVVGEKTSENLKEGLEYISYPYSGVDPSVESDIPTRLVCDINATIATHKYSGKFDKPLGELLFEEYYNYILTTQIDRNFNWEEKDNIAVLSWGDVQSHVHREVYKYIEKEKENYLLYRFKYIIFCPEFRDDGEVKEYYGIMEVTRE